MARSFAELLRYYRVRIGLTKQDLAEAAQIGRNSISDWESGKRVPRSRGLMQDLAEALKLSQSEEEQLAAAVHEAKQSPESAAVPSMSQQPSAVLYATPGVFGGPKRLFGRERLIAQIDEALDKHQRVLLTGFTGIGKTAVAATVAEQRLLAASGNVLWVSAGDATGEVLYEEIATRLGNRSAVLSQHGVGKQLALLELLTQATIILVVVDNVWRGSAFHELLQAIPKSVHVLATSQLRLPLEMIEVGELAPDDALTALYYFAGTPKRIDGAASELCGDLGYHPYAIELAGMMLRVDNASPKQLQNHIVGAIHHLRAPEEFAATGRQSIYQMLETSYLALDTASRETLTLIGSLFGPGVTASLIATCLNQELSTIVDGLNSLVRRSLAKRYPETDYFVLHDLTFSYVQTIAARSPLPKEQIAIAVDRYLTQYKQDFDRIDLDLQHILGAASGGSQEMFVRTMSLLIFGGYPTPEGRSYMDDRGHNLALVEQLDAAIRAANELPNNNEALHYLLSKRGNVHFDRRELDAAHDPYCAALEQAPSVRRKVILLAMIGKVLADQLDNERSADHLNQARRIAEGADDYEAQMFVLEVQSYCAGQRGDHAAARDFASDAVIINRRTNNPERLGYALLNLGSAELQLGNNRMALVIHQEALATAEAAGLLQLQGHIHHALGEDHHVIGEAQKAQAHFDKAIALCRKTGDLENEAQILNFMELHGYTSQSRTTS